jgi:hypothetical protein
VSPSGIAGPYAFDERLRKVRDFRAMVPPKLQKSPFGVAGEVTDRAELTDQHYSTGEPEGSPARPAADERGYATRRLRRVPCVRDE